MNKTLRDATLGSLLLLCILFLPSYANAQTPGLIYKIATNGGNKVLDPNGDGYVSKTSLGFQLVDGNRLDEGSDYSEIPYRPFPVFMDEPLADLKTGGSYGHTDFAPKVYANGKVVGSPMASYYDGKNFLFRVRLAGQSTASKGYSILIDTNNTLTGTGTNPGFEFEVLLATNFDVRVIDYRTNPSGTLLFTGSVDQYSQKAIAGSLGNGDADYFYDFYVPMSAFGSAITPTTQLRMTGVTVTSAKSGIFGVTSDLGGVDDNVYGGNTLEAWKDVITSSPPTTPIGIQTGPFPEVYANAPTINRPLTTASTVITGYSVEAVGSVISIYQNNVLLGSTTVTSAGTWSFNIAATTLIANSLVNATVKPSSKSLSPSSNSVIVQLAGCTPATPTITSIDGTKGLYVTVAGAGTINIYRNGVLQTISNGSNVTTAAGSKLVSFGNGAGSMPEGSAAYHATFTVGSCTSANSNSVCYIPSNGNNSITEAFQVPTVTNTSITPSSTTFTGSVTIPSTLSPAILYLYKNGASIAQTAQLTTGTNNWTYTFPAVPAVGDIYYVIVESVNNTTCGTKATSKSITLTVTDPTASTVSIAPTITGNYCGASTTITGTSSEAPGTSISIYRLNADNTIIVPAVGTTPVNAFGTWSAIISSIAPGTKVAARATAIGKTESGNSAPVTIGNNSSFSSSNLTLTASALSPIYEGATNISGTAPANAVITLYIDGSPYVNKDGLPLTETSNGTWTFTTIPPFEIYAGAKLTITAKAAGTSCESNHSAAVIVACNPVSTAITAALTAAKFCPGTPAYIKLSTTEAGVIYNIYRNIHGNYTPFGPSVLGTGAPLTLQSDPITIDGTKLQVRTVKVGASCQSKIGGDANNEFTVSLYPPVPRDFTVTATPESSACANVSTIIAVLAAETGYSYQLINNDTKEKIGAPIIPSINGDISFPPVIVSKTTTYGVVITGTASGCVAENTILKMITISGGPDVNRVVSTSHLVVCVGNTTNSNVTLNVVTQSNHIYRIYQQTSPTTSTKIGIDISGTGGTVATTLPNSLFATTGVKELYVTVSGISGTTSCSDLKMTNTVKITVTDGSPSTVEEVKVTNCGSTYTFIGSNPTLGTGRWIINSKPASANPVITSTTLYNSTVTDLVPGTYVFDWVVTTSCNTTVIIRRLTLNADCPAIYSVQGNKYVDEYNISDELIKVSDPEGIQSVSIITGKGTLPPNTYINTTTGLVYVTGPLTAGTYRFSLRTTDKLGNITEEPLQLTFMARGVRPPDITPLPVELMSFTATNNFSGVILNWVTASELDNDKFEIERSEDGKLFSKIGTVSGNGTSNRKIKYSFTDTKPLSGLSYYRLKQVDFDGTHKYSKIISFKNKVLSANTILEAYPNPFSEKLSVTITVPVPEEATLTLYNLQGRQLQTIKTTLEKGMNNYELDTQQLASGIYIIRITGNNSDVSAKVLKK